MEWKNCVLFLTNFDPVDYVETVYDRPTMVVNNCMDMITVDRYLIFNAQSTTADITGRTMIMNVNTFDCKP